MIDEQELRRINDEFALYIRDMPRKEMSIAEMDQITEELRAILRQYQGLVAPD